MFRLVASLPFILSVSGFGTTAAAERGSTQDPSTVQLPALAVTQRTAETPPLTLDAALTEALANNPELIFLRRQFEATRERPAQERFLAAPTFEAQIWQWPINTLDPTNTNMYMFMFGQDIPGPGKRRLREAVAQKDVAFAETDVAVRARHVVDQVKRAYAALFLAERPSRFITRAWICYASWLTSRKRSTPPGESHNRMC